MRAAEAEGREYEPVTERGRAVHAARQARAMFRDMRERLDMARETYGLAREEGQGRVSAGLAALRAAAARDGRERSPDEIRDRLAQIVERDQGREEAAREDSAEKRESVKDRLSSLLDRSKPVEIEQDGEEQELDDERQVEKDRGHDLDSGGGWSL